MRKCFEDGRVNYRKYDACFANALKTESDQTLCQIALTRLSGPRDLSENARFLYEEALADRAGSALNEIIHRRNLPMLTLFLDILHRPGQKNRSRDMSGRDYNALLSRCIQADWVQGASLMMELRQRQTSFANKKFSF